MKIAQTAPEIVPKAEKYFTKVTQAADEQAVVDVELVETARQLQPVDASNQIINKRFILGLARLLRLSV